ncbi:MAG TPA: radical SAM protein [Gemmatimonas sp.]|nr:radical SAM protein [Gemmatimonas sp.]
MLSSRYSPWHVPLFLGKYAWLRARKSPVLVNIEVTMRCNARCSFCDYWKTPAETKKTELTDFGAIASHFNPMVVTFTGGEPTLRRDLEAIVSSVRRAAPLTYLQMITHGGMLSLERAQSLWDAGIDQFNISLDYLDGRHDEARGIPGLTAKILDIVPRMRAAGIGGVKFNSVIKRDNLDQLLPLAEKARAMQSGVNFSLYTDSKNGNGKYLFDADQHAALDRAVSDLLAFKRRHRGAISNSEYYLEQIPRYVRGEMTEKCEAGISTIHIDPHGMVRRCPDFPSDGPWQDYKGYEPIECNACYYACRGEAQAPIRILSRIRDVMA